MNIHGIQYLNDSNGTPQKAIVDLRVFGKEFNQFLQQIAARVAAENANNSNIYRPEQPSNQLSGKVEQLLSEARKYIGTPYRTGGTTSSGMDCSGFTMTVFKAIGVSLPRVSRDQAAVGTTVAKSQLRAGDLLFFATTTPNLINHVGIVSSVDASGKVLFIHASSSRGVMEADMSLAYWQNAYMTARRIV